MMYAGVVLRDIGGEAVPPPLQTVLLWTHLHLHVRK